MLKAKVIEVIKLVSTEGKGTKEDPVRTVAHYWEKDGKFIGKRENYGLVEPTESKRVASS